MLTTNCNNFETFRSGADPGRNLTRDHVKARGCGPMGVALIIGCYKLDLVNAAQWST